VQYTEEQRRAIEYLDGDQAIIATAGSGKTQVLIDKVLHLIRSGVRPDSIMLVAYTNAAADEMRERLGRAARSASINDKALDAVMVDTLHGCSLRLLREHLPEHRNWRVLDDVERNLLVTSYYDALRVREVACVSGAHKGKPACTRYGAPRTLFAAVDFLRGRRQEICDAAKIPAPLLETVRRYERLLQVKHAFDFAGVLVTALDALSDTADPLAVLLQQAVAARFRWVLCDEAQDFGALEWRLLHRFRELGANLVVVGDINQHLHGFRGVTACEFEEFASSPTTARAELCVNHRSHGRLVELQKQVLSWHGMRTVDVRSTPRLAEFSGRLTAVHSATKKDEARAVALWVKERVAEGVAADEIAILYRKGAHLDDISQAYKQALRAEGIQFQVQGSHLLGSPVAEAVARSFEFLGGLKPWLAARAAWCAAGLGIDDARLEAAARLLEKYRCWDDSQGRVDLQVILLRLLEAIRLSDADALKEIGPISTAISHFEVVSRRLPASEVFRRFALWLRNVAPAEYRRNGFGHPSAQGAVHIGVIHGAKGRQFRAVCLPSMQEGLFPYVGEEDETDPIWSLIPIAAVGEMSRQRDNLAEETRVFYVGVSRAKQHLLISAHGQNPSRFFTGCAGLPLFHKQSGDAVTWPEDATPSEEPTVRLTATELNVLMECPHRYRLQRLGFQPPSSVALNYGASCAEVMEEVRKLVKAGVAPDDLPVRSLVEQHLYLPNADKVDLPRWREVAETAVRSQVEQHWEKMQATISQEHELVARVDGLEVQVRVDAVEKTSSGGVRLVSDKTSYDFDPDVQSAAVERFQNENAIPALALYQQEGKVPEESSVRIVSRGGTEDARPVTMTTVEQAEAAMVRVRDLIRAGKYPTWQGDMDEPWCPCWRCDQRYVCEKWQGHLDADVRASQGGRAAE
jgi:superfamily I DNA/RNA helicase